MYLHFFKYDINPCFDKRLKQREKVPTMESHFDAQFKREMIDLISLGVESEAQHTVEPAENLPSYRFGGGGGRTTTFERSLWRWV